MSHSALRSAQIQKMRSLVGMPVLQVFQYVGSLEQLWLQRICSLAFMDPDGNAGDNYVALRLNPCHLQKKNKKRNL